METLNNQHLSNEINIINKINILIDKIDHLEFNNNLTKIQKTYMIMLESTRKFLDDFIRVFSIITGTLTTILITSKL